MSAYRFWRGYDSANSRFIQFNLRRLLRMYGTPVVVHRYAGPVERKGEGSDAPSWKDWMERGDATLPDYAVKGGSTEVDIQDLLFLENRDRKYDRTLYEVWGWYRLDTPNFDLRQFGITISDDTPEMAFALTELVDVLGRPLVPGDVLELPHRRMGDFDGGTPVNRYYVVEDAFRPGGGWDPHWLPHLWACRCSPVRDQQEFFDVLSRNWRDADGLPEDGVSVLEVISTADGQLALTDAVREEGSRIWPFWYVQQGHLYIFPEWQERTGPTSGDRPMYRLLCTFGDGEPPNGARPVGRGTSFPQDANDGDFFLRTDYVRPVLFRRENGRWTVFEIDWRRPWTPSTDALAAHVNERGTVRHDSTGEDIEQRQSPARALMPPRRRRKGVAPDV